jgi:autotransporter-associated beta strand protein
MVLQLDLSTLEVSGTSNLGANVTTSSTQTYTGDVTISNDITLTTTNSNVSFGGTVDSSGTSSSTTASILLTDIDTGNTETITGTAGQTTNHVPTRNDVYDRATLSAYSTAILYDGMELYGEITTIDNSSGSSSTTVDFTDGQLSSLTLSGEIVNSSDASTLTIAAGSGDVTFTDAVGGTTAMGNITITTGALSAAAIKVQGTIDITNTDTSSITGIISDGASSAIVTKAGSGTLTLSGNNTYTGQTNINAGIISITHNNALGSADGATIVADGASVSISNDITSAENITISGTGISSNGAIRNTADDNTLTGLITLGANSEIQIDSGSSLTLNPTTGNAITGTYNLTIESVGTSSINDPIAISTGNIIKLVRVP